VEDLATPEEVAAYLGVKPQTLAVWVTRKVGPPFIKIEGRRRYRWSDIREYVDARTVRRG
jgi:DNA-binding transcriptional MerR regulator